MNEYITIITIVLFVAGAVLEILVNRVPKLQITGDLSKLLCSYQFEQAARYIMGSQQLTQNLPKLTQFYQNLHEIIVSFMLTIGIKFCTLL